MRFNTLSDWLSWQETLHPTEIELGLERVSQVLERLEFGQPNFSLITVAGTNGKGSSVAILEAILLAAGYRVGTYTSPHLLRYNERIKLNGQPVDDTVLCESFQRIDDARLAVAGNEISLSYFEFGTLAAIDILQRSAVEVAILEVGLGGRLDAVNVLDADVALITAIDVDHADWLGDDRETIAVEKAGIMRADRPAVCADPQPPASLSATAVSLGAPLAQLGRDFFVEQKGDTWCWWNSQQRFDDLPLPALSGDFQVHNAAGVLAVLSALQTRLPVSAEAFAEGLRSAKLAGRFQIIPGAPQQIFDVAHNPQSAQALAQNLDQQPCDGETHAVFAMLADKDIPAVLEQLAPRVDHWYLAPLDVPRAASLAQVQSALRDASIPVSAIPFDSIRIFDTVHAAFLAALDASHAQDRIVVTGSFYTVAAVLDETV